MKIDLHVPQFQWFRGPRSGNNSNNKRDELQKELGNTSNNLQTQHSDVPDKIHARANLLD